MSSDFSARHEPRAENGAGLTGFILSVCGMMCFIMFPIGLIGSLIGLQKEPKGFAIAGTIIGALGTAATIMLVVIYGAMILAMGAACAGVSAAVQTEIDTRNAIETASIRIENYRDDNDRLPSERPRATS